MTQRPHRPTPEEKYLEKKRAELAVLENRLADRELELETLRGGLMAFEKHYQAVMNEKYAQLDALYAQIYELLPLRSDPPASQGSEQEKAAAKPQATAAPSPRRPRPKNLPPRPPAPPAPPQPEFNPAEMLKRLYRDVAKALHPDFAEGDDNRQHRHQFMIRANEAYEASDEKKLLAILQEWEHHPESVRGSGAGVDLVRCIRKIDWCELRMVQIDADIQQLQASPTFNMKLMADEAAQFERDLLGEMTQRLDEEIAAATAQLEDLRSRQPPAVLAPPAPASEEQQPTPPTEACPPNGG